ncbi:Fis family transcriptional regulator [Marinicellulosiphila megalodicopiae]|uniref:Fis family transcriptional regulator n=1 Tax=Marinicellulosiphila megalodicopiae TaxID=2724896 RepID=UPI003BB17FAB
MRKIDKKIDNQIIKALTQICEVALEEINGFIWLTHSVNFSHFPKSLKIICVFDSIEHLNDYLIINNGVSFGRYIQKQFKNIDIEITNKHIFFDTQEKCIREHNGNWAKRLA